VVDWFAHHTVPNFPLNFAPSARWFSEALLPSAFLARSRGDSLAELWTHADATIGHFNVGSNRKTDCTRFHGWFVPLLERVGVDAIAWELVIDHIRSQDPDFGHQLAGYYDRCLAFNGADSAE
jgi:hypothetical protein